MIRGTGISSSLSLFLPTLSPSLFSVSGYDQCADIYSFSCVLHELVTGDPPRAKHHPLNAIFSTATKGAVALEGRTELSADLIDFYNKASTFHANKRPKATQLLQVLYDLLDLLLLSLRLKDLIARVA